MPISAHKNTHKFVRNTSNKIRRATHHKALTLVVRYGQHFPMLQGEIYSLLAIISFLVAESLPRQKSHVKFFKSACVLVPNPAAGQRKRGLYKRIQSAVSRVKYKGQWHAISGQQFEIDGKQSTQCWRETSFVLQAKRSEDVPLIPKSKDRRRYFASLVMLQGSVSIEKFFILDITNIPPAYSPPQVHRRIFLSSFTFTWVVSFDRKEFFLILLLFCCESGFNLERVSSIPLKIVRSKKTTEAGSTFYRRS